MSAKVSKDIEALATILYLQHEDMSGAPEGVKELAWRSIPGFQKEHWRRMARVADRHFNG